MLHAGPHSHSREHAFSFLNGRAREGLTVFSRRSMLKASMAGLAGLTLPGLLQVRGEAVKNGQPIRGNKSVILLWMAGGPSHIDTWDVKPDMPTEMRGPARQVHAHPLGGLSREQSSAKYGDADGKPRS